MPARARGVASTLLPGLSRQEGGAGDTGEKSLREALAAALPSTLAIDRSFEIARGAAEDPSKTHRARLHLEIAERVRTLMAF